MTSARWEVVLLHPRSLQMKVQTLASNAEFVAENLPWTVLASIKLFARRLRARVLGAHSKSSEHIAKEAPKEGLSVLLHQAAAVHVGETEVEEKDPQLQQCQSEDHRGVQSMIGERRVKLFARRCELPGSSLCRSGASQIHCAQAADHLRLALEVGLPLVRAMLQALPQGFVSRGRHHMPYLRGAWHLLPAD